MVLNKHLQQNVLWWAIFCGALIPAVLLFIGAYKQQLGADPAKEIVLQLGTWAINFLWASLAITPIRKVLGWGWLAKYRRMLGLFSFFYVLLHLLAFATFMLGWKLSILLIEITERPYAIVGFIALLLLIPLAVTSTKAMQRKLKQRRLTLHKLVYLIALLSLLHIVWQIRADFFEALVYALLLSWLLGYRLYARLKRKMS